MRKPPKSNSAKKLFDIIISSIFIKYYIQKYHLSSGAHICVNNHQIMGSDGMSLIWIQTQSELIKDSIIKGSTCMM